MKPLWRISPVSLRGLMVMVLCVCLLSTTNVAVAQLLANEEVETIACSLCPDGSSLQIDQINPLLGTSCGDIASEVGLLAEDQCEVSSLEERFGIDPQALCCSVVLDLISLCPLCTEDQTELSTESVQTTTYGRVPCENLFAAARLTSTSESCQRLRQEAGEGCCADSSATSVPSPTLGSSPCALTCPDGNPPPNPFLTDPVTGFSCERLAQSFRTFQSDAECARAVKLLGFDAVAFCCPGAPVPVNPCPFCAHSETETLIYPERILYTFRGHSCQELEESLRYVVQSQDSRLCEEILDDARVSSNCVCKPVEGFDVEPRDPSSPTSSPRSESSITSVNASIVPHMLLLLLCWRLFDTGR